MDKKKVLFLCTGNSCRSQMAEGLLRHLAGERFEVFSAGVAPASKVHPLAIKVMAEIGIDISTHWPKAAQGFIKDSFDYVITVCDNARQTCPIFPGGAQKIHWDIPDPAAIRGSESDILSSFRKIRDLVRKNIQEFI